MILMSFFILAVVAMIFALHVMVVVGAIICQSIAAIWRAFTR